MHPSLRLSLPLAVFLLAACGNPSNNGDAGTDAAVAPSCSDGEQNGNETDIDCGGGCEPCELTKQCAAGTDCRSGVCEGNVCVECATASECPGEDGTCATRTCTNGACGFSYAAAGTELPDQTAGDCKTAVCDGAGGLTTETDDADLPGDMNGCTVGACTDGVPSQSPRLAGTACLENNGTMCDGEGACVQCIQATDCSGEDTACSMRTCNDGVCGVSFTADGTAVPEQTAGDCQEIVCDGNGATTSRALDTDLPDDNKACTEDLCTAGVPSHPPLDAGEVCSENGGALCDGAGACVSCLTANDCPGSDSECSTRTCTAGVCGVSHAAAGTPVAQQTAGDCQQNVCNGSGTVVSQALNTDVPNDANQCTGDVCVNGVPSHPNTAAGAMCSQNGGTLCDGAGACVSCRTASDCPGSDTECSTRTCNAGVCGVSHAAAGTPVAQQTAGDCQQNVCDGSGTVVSQALNTDVPNDANQCTGDVCVNGVPSHPNSAAGATCSQNGGTLCDGAGACVSCLTANDCPGSDTECSTRTCNAGVCGVSHVAAGTPVAQQTAGDCQQNVCDGSGTVVSQALNTDLPADDGNQCTTATCVAGAPSHPNAAAGATCSQNGGSLCDGNGACVGCLTASDCPGSDSECSTRTCNAGACGVSFTAAGTPVAQQTSGDCQQNVCDGNGAVTSQALNSDVPADDGNQCTSATCVAGVPSHPNVGAGATCSQNGGTLCDGSGACVSCLTASDCPGSDTECSTRTCNAGACGVSFTAAGTPVAQQTAGDCQQNVCDGNGAVVSQALNSDLPADDGNQCTAAACVAGVPQHPGVAAGQTCSQNGGTLCDGAGACVSCLTANDCPGSDSECSTRTCNAGVCGVSNAAAGTPVAQQTAGDCQQNVCDGNGAVVSQALNSDLPADDGNQCTAAACVAGVPQHPNEAQGTACSQSGGSICDGAGACVGCLAASDCPGQDSECGQRTCNSGVCGMSYTAAGTPVAQQTSGDCQQNVCNGSGAIVSQALNTDVPADDGNQCTASSCVAGVPQQQNAAAGASCSQNGGSQCDGAGLCVQCLAATDCPGSETECQARTCTAGACGFAYVTAGTPVSAQTSGDCQQNVCDGSGAIVAQAQDSDLPNDGNQCTADTCVNGVPTLTAQPAGATCSQNGGSQCNGTGACVECVAATDCPGSDTECSVRTCQSGVCGVANAPAGQPLTEQTGGDCQQTVCDGSGGTLAQALDTDLPVDGNQCTQDVCTAGVPSNPPASQGSTCGSGGAGTCDGAGQCVECVTATDCPGSDTECSERTCFSGTCGVSNAPQGQPLAHQTAGDCQQMVCDGEGGTMGAAQDGDLPDDGLECTTDTCVSGQPQFTNSAAGSSCSQGGGSVCDGSGVCVGCVLPTDCAGSDTECSARTCFNGTCGISHAPNGQPVSSQTEGNCTQNVCDGNGGTTVVQDNADAPANAAACSVGVCEEGVPGQLPAPQGTQCSENGGTLCDGVGACVQCVTVSDCPGSDTECSTRTCTAGTCGTNNTPDGTALTQQTAGDCRTDVCDGMGGTRAEANASDLPNDGNACTDDTCNGTTATHTPVATGTACSQNSGSYCSASAACVECTENSHCASGSVCTSAGACASAVLGVTPANAALNVPVNTTVVVTFSQAVNPSSLTFNSAPGACTGSVQVSSGTGFTQCVGIASVTMSNGDTTATFTLGADLTGGETYRVRVTTGVTGANGIPLAAQSSQADGFTTYAPPAACGGRVVISQVYGGGGNSGATFRNDYVELHNVGGAPVDLQGWFIQYASDTGNFGSNNVPLSGVIQPGRFFLVQMAGGANGVVLPTADLVQSTAPVNMSGSNGKVLLSTGPVAVTGACPTSDARVVDFVGFGSANCREGGTTNSFNAPAPSTTTAIFRDVAGCFDSNNNRADFFTGTPAPRNSASDPAFCACSTNGQLNESNEPDEADFCNVQDPHTVNVQRNGSTADIYGRIYEAGRTEAAGAPAGVRAQLGYSRPGTSVMSNNWAWFEAAWHVQTGDYGNDDEYRAQIRYAGSNSSTANNGNLYSYLYRFSFDDGLSWTYCDVNGAGANGGLDFDLANAGVMTVTP